ncbi:MAG: InlB B-repeat-containing protein, partial [Gordonibacter sp.]
MSMLEKLCDARHTIEGKALSILVSAVLALSLINLSSIAYAAGEGSASDASAAPTAAAPAVDDASDTADTADTSGMPGASDDASGDNQTTAPGSSDAGTGAPQDGIPPVAPPAPTDDLPVAESGVAVVSLEFSHGFLEYLGQTIAPPIESVKVPLNKEFLFTAHADEGFELDKVKTVVADVEVELVANDAGEYRIPRDQVTSTLTIKVEGKEKVLENGATPSEDVAAAPITSDTVIGANDETADIEPEGATKDVVDGAAQNEEVVANVSSPAFEGYAQAGNVLVKVTAAEGALPEGTTVRATQITSSAVIDAVEATVEGQGRELESAVAVDVTLVGPEGNVIQPNAAVNVCFFNAGIAGDTMGVYHVANDGSSVDPVSARQADPAAQSFDVSHFSIYVVTAEGTPHLATYNFYGVDGTTLIDTQIVKTGDALYEPGTPAVDEGQSFQGWYAKNGSEWADKFSTFGEQAVTETATYDLYAKSSELYYVYFMDNRQIRVYTAKSGTPGDIITTDVAFPLGPNESVTGWYTDKELQNKVDSVELKTSNVTLYPKVETGKWVNFVAQGGSYTAPKFIGVGGVSVEPAKPIRSGYDFAGWYDNESCKGDAYSFGTELAKDTTLYAKWEAAEAEYNVVVWLEAADSTPHAMQYDYVTTFDYQGKTDEVVTLPGAAEFKTRVDSFSIDKQHILDAADESSDKAITVKGDGSAIANVYLNRAEYTIDLRCSAKSSDKESAYKDTYPLVANYGADISAQWADEMVTINKKYGIRVWVANPKSPGSTENPVIAPFQTMTEDRTLYYVICGDALHHLELYVEDVGNGAAIEKLSPEDPRYQSGSFSYSKKYDTTMFQLEDTLVFKGSGVHASIPNYANALNGFEWVGADLSTNQGFFNVNGTWTARHYFQRKAYTITFNNQNVVSTSGAIKYGWSIKDEGAAPDAKDAGVPEGSTFAGWYTSPTFAEGTEFNFNGATMPARNLVLYAKWVLPTYKVTYYIDMDASSVAATHDVSYGETTSSEPSSIARVPEGYKWVGWMTRSGSGGDYTYLPFNFNTQAYGDIELYPYYINDESYSVSYHANGGTGEVPTDGHEYAQGSFAEVAKNTLAAPSADQMFLGWSTRSDGSGATYYPGGMVQLGGADVTLYAQWGQPAPQTSLIYDANGGEGSRTTMDIANNGETILKTEKELNFQAPRADMNFAGWNTKADGTGTSFAAGTAARVNIDEGENVLYAQWKEKTKLVLAAESKSKTYDGTPLTGSQVSLTSGNLASGDKLMATTSGSITNVSENVAGNNKVISFSIVDGVEDVTSNYIIEVLPGTLTIMPAPVTLKSTDLSKAYDGTPLMSGGGDPTVLSGGWAPREGATYTFEGSVLLPGETAANKYAYQLNQGTSASNYAIDAQYGELKITDRTDAEKYQATVVANSGGGVYNGTNYTVSGFVGEVAGKGIPITAEGQTYYVTGLVAEKTGKDVVDSGAVTVSGDPKVKDVAGNDVSGQFVITPTDGSLTITPAQVTVKSADLSKPYDGTALTNGATPLIANDGWVTGEGAAYAFTGSVTQPGETAANEFTWAFNEGTLSGNYTVSPSFGQLSIENRDAKYEIQVEANSGSKTYDGAALEVSGFKNESDKGIEVKTADGGTYYVTGLASQASGKNVSDSVASIPMTGTAVVKDAQGNDVSSQFNVTLKTGSLTIDKRALTLESETFSKEYDGTPQTNGAAPLKVEDGWVWGEGATYAFPGSVVLPGMSVANAIAITFNEGTLESNYQLNKIEGTLSVKNRDTKYAADVSANSGGGVYNGTDYTVSGFKGEVEAPGIGKAVEIVVEGHIYYVTGLVSEKTGRGVADSDEVPITGTAVVRDAAGNDVTSQFKINPNPGTLVIAARPVTVIAGTPTAKEYDGTALTDSSWTVAASDVSTGLVGGDTIDRVTVSGSQLYPGTSPNVSSDAVFGQVDPRNYAVNYVNGTLEVTDRAVKYALKANAAKGSVLYDAVEHAVQGVAFDNLTFDGQTYTVEGLAASVAATNVNRDGAHDGVVVPYAASIQGQAVVRDAAGRDVTAQFSIDTADKAELTIKPRLLAVASPSDEKVYDGSPLTSKNLAFSGDGFAQGEGASFDVTGSQTLVGFAPNTFTTSWNAGTSVHNYELTEIVGTLTVKNRDAKYEVEVTANSGGGVYNGTDYTASGFVNEVADKGIQITAEGQTYYVTGLVAEKTGKDVVDSGAVTVSGAALVKDEAGNDVSSQFDIKPVPGKLTITPASVVLKSIDLSKAYDGTPLVNDGTLPAVIGGGWAPGEGATYTFEGSVLLPGETAANKYAYQLNQGTSASNYAIDAQYGELKI